MEVAPEKKTIDSLFSATHYYIDFYQREYKWPREAVLRLIEDLFYPFEQTYQKYPTLDVTPELICSKYSGYYLNTIITNKHDSRVFVVDGQQRLTTLTLLLVALYHMAGKNGNEDADLQAWLRERITGIGMGGKKLFWVANDKRAPLMKVLFDGGEPSDKLLDDTITARHIIDNYRLIQSELSKRLTCKHQLQTFTYYFLCTVVLVNLEVTQADVPMVFEAINDRGVRLQSYEILKGKLLGQIDKAEVERFTDIWDKGLHLLEIYGEGEADFFFRTYFKARLCASRPAGQELDGAYHRKITEDQYDTILLLNRNTAGVKAFLNGPFQYYSKLLHKLRLWGKTPHAECPECYYCSELHDMDGHIMLCMAACSTNDTEEDAKIKAVTQAFDRAFVILQLNRAYDSNRFQEILFELMPSLRAAKAEDIQPLINAKLLTEIQQRKGTTADSLLSYSQFKQVGYGDFLPRFLRYFLTRIEMYVTIGLDTQMQTTIWNYVRGQGRGNAYHIEHILAHNEQSYALFKDPEGELDEALFGLERNRFGGLLLLKGQDNQSSGAEDYDEKLRTYTGSAPYWAQTLVSDFYKSNSAMEKFIEHSKLDFKPEPVFGRDTLERRSKLVFDMAKRIWNV
jgi:hypothetical protein